jgi:hypothetical protein
MTSRRAVYPDISDVLARKRRGRERLAALPFSTKIKLLEAMRARDETIRKARKLRLKRSDEDR